VSGAGVQRQAVRYPGGYTAHYRWAGPAAGEAVFSTPEGAEHLADHEALGGAAGDRLCRAEVQVEGPLGRWTARLAAPIFDAPQGLLWDTAGLFVVTYGFHVYAFEARGGALRWSHAGATPLVGLVGSTRLDHVLLQSELETTALRADGSVAWRATHEDVITAVELVAGRLVLGTWSGGVVALDPMSGARLA
jgi:outer membrane protein assembly factor BamB